MPEKHLVFSSERLPKMLVEATILLLKLQSLNKQIDEFEQCDFFLKERKKILYEKVDTWIKTNIVTK